MIKSINPAEPRKYTLKKDTENPTVWLIKVPTYKEDRFLASLVGKQTDLNDLLDVTEKALHVFLLGAENSNIVWEKDEKAEDIYPGVKPWSEKTLSQMDRDTRDELAGDILTGGKSQEKSIQQMKAQRDLLNEQIEEKEADLKNS